MTGIKSFGVAILGLGVLADQLSWLRQEKSRMRSHNANYRRQSEPTLVHSLCAASLSTISATTWGYKRKVDPLTKPNILEVSCNGTNDVVLVTGGAGFLGQHIVKLLQEKCDDVGEIRVFDVKPYENKLGHTNNKPVKSYVGDITKPADINEAVKGVNSVIHTAGVVSFGTFPDYKAMEEVNVQGTSNLVDACISQNVSHLVFTSTIDVVIGYDDIINGDETLKAPKRFLFPGYPDTKFRAEKIVISANGMELGKGDGSRLHTISLRPNIMYGEGDPYFIPSALRSAKSNNGILTRIGSGKALFQQAYVGNMAWAHIKALSALKVKPNACSGRAYFITDDTPLCNTFEFMDIFLRTKGYDLSNYSLPYPFVYGFMYIMETVFWVISPIYKIHLDTALCSVIYFNKTYYFCRKFAEQKIGYSPIYTYKECIANSIAYYSDLEL